MLLLRLLLMATTPRKRASTSRAVWHHFCSRHSMISNYAAHFVRCFSAQPAAAPLLSNKDYFWCTCGKSVKQVRTFFILSNNTSSLLMMLADILCSQPFCDGSHKGSGMKSLKFSIPTDATKFLCICKLTKNPPYCDGSHSNVGGVSLSGQAASAVENVSNT
jgi:CDGSH-type Zn-finger protein